MFSLDTFRDSLARPRPYVPWTEGFSGGRNDSPKPKDCLSKLGEALLSPLDCCGREWQRLQLQTNDGVLQKTLCIAKKALLRVGILFAMIPGISGSLIKCVSNPPLEQDGIYRQWELEMNDAQHAQCDRLGLHDFNRDINTIRSSVISFSRQYPDYLQTSSNITIRKSGHRGFFNYTIAIPMHTYGVARPSGNGFCRNIVNSFRPSQVPTLQFGEIKVLQDLLLGIRSGTAEDHRRIRESLGCCTKLEFTMNWHPDANGHSPNTLNCLNRLDLKIFY